MNGKRFFSTELAYALGLIILALGTALMEKADFGMSMVVAPAYLLHLKISQVMPAYSFGMSEYVLQAVLLIALSCIMKRLKKGYLFSFVTAVIYGFLLDGCMSLTALMGSAGIVLRAVCYVSGMVLCSIGVAMLFHTYISPEAYELFVKELSEKLHVPTGRMKTVYDCVSCGVSIVMSFAFFGFGHFEGIKLGTVFCALVNGWLIGRISALLEKRYTFRDTLPMRTFFES